jgi:succinate dehydrogenase membrane anchor subunit
VRQETLNEHAGGMWPWLFQRITAVVLIVGLAVHLFALHVVNLGSLSYDNVAGRLSSGFFVVVDFALLGAGLFHALNGLRTVLLDYGFRGGRRTALTVGLWVVGVAAFAYGTWALWPWLTS